MRTTSSALLLSILALLLYFLRQKHVKCFLLFLFVVSGTGSRAEIMLHRAVEPARMGLDISISGENLTLYIALKEESLSVLKKKMDLKLLYEQLKRLSHFALPSTAARCRIVEVKVDQSMDRINGFQTFHCERPGQLKYIDVKLYEALPDLKAIDVWLTTENWQSKTVVYPGKLQVTIKSGILR